MADSTQLVAAQMAYENEKKNGTAAWLLWLFLGGLGGHRYYMGDIGYALAMTFLNWMTLGIWSLVDAFFINNRLRTLNAQKQQEVFQRFGVMAPAYMMNTQAPAVQPYAQPQALEAQPQPVHAQSVQSNPEQAQPAQQITLPVPATEQTEARQAQ